MTGVLSQATVNLTMAEQQVATLSALPAAAQPIRSSSVALMGRLIADLRTVQQAVTSFVASAAPQLRDIQGMVSSQQPLAAINAAMNAVHGEAGSLKTSIDNFMNGVNSARTQIFLYFEQLSTIQGDVRSQTTTLQGQLGDAQSREEVAKKKYYWLIALGPFGLVGLAAALALYQQWTAQVNRYESQIHALNAQISSLNGMVSVCNQMKSDFSTVVAKLTSVQNDVNFLVSDILNIDQQLAQGNNYTLLAIAANAATTEVTTLGVDAS